MVLRIMQIVLFSALGISSLASAGAKPMAQDFENLNRIYTLACDGDPYSRMLSLTSEDAALGRALKVWYTESSDQKNPLKSAVRNFPKVLIKDGLELVREGEVDGPAPGKNKVVIDKRFDSHSISLTESHILNGSKRFQRAIALNFTDQELTSGELTKEYYWPGQNEIINCSFEEYR